LKFKKLLIAAVVIVMAAFSCVTAFAAELADYKLELTYTVTNSGDTERTAALAYRFDEIADTSAYQPGTAFAVEGIADGYEVSDNRVAVAPGESKSVTMSWTLSGGDFDQNLTYTEATRKAREVYEFVTANIVYGEEQDYALPKTATCQTFAAVFYDRLTELGVEVRKVYGYTERLVDKDGKLTFGSADISHRDMHVWCEWYDDERGEWFFCDPTFDAGERDAPPNAFAFFGKCSANSPHIAMYYGSPMLRKYTMNGDLEYTRTARLTRSAYTDDDTATENLLERGQRNEDEAALIAKYAAERGLSISLNRNADRFRLLNGSEIQVPSDWRVMVNNNTGELMFEGGNRTIRVSFAGNGKYSVYKE
jgi:hypothetical protein